MREPEAKKATGLAADLHIHSALSPCAGDDMVPSNLIPRLMRAGIEVFSITDHNACRNSAAFERAASESGLHFIPGVEVQSQEEIHLLGYFPNISDLDRFEKDFIKPNLIEMENVPSRFGSQLVLGVNGDVLGSDNAMLSMPLSLSIEKLCDGIHDRGGLSVAAHIDREFSVVSQLGYIPEGLRLDAVEVQDLTKLDEISREILHDCDARVLSSSDCHHLDMVKAPKMKLWMEEIGVRSCLDCIAGLGGSISMLARGSRGKPKSMGGRGHDWKHMYTPNQ